MLPEQFIEEAMSEQMTMRWGFWGIKPPTDEDVEASRMPSEIASEEVKDDHESICLACAFKQLREDSENMQAEMFDLKNQVQHLIKILGGK